VLAPRIDSPQKQPDRTRLEAREDVKEEEEHKGQQQQQSQQQQQQWKRQ
jgi:hypothetical protein